jgi:hypothetical protein
MEPIESPADLEMPEVPAADAVVLPRETEDEVGLYDDSVVTLVKELRQAGASAEFLHGPESRTWIGEKGVEPLALDLLIGIAGNAGWDALRAVLRHRGNKRVEVKVARHVEKGDGSVWEWFQADGEGEAVAAALEGWRAEDGAGAGGGAEE